MKHEWKSFSASQQLFEAWHSFENFLCRCKDQLKLQSEGLRKLVGVVSTLSSRDAHRSLQMYSDGRNSQSVR
jgi:hypothetical protein